MTPTTEDSLSHLYSRRESLSILLTAEPRIPENTGCIYTMLITSSTTIDYAVFNEMPLLLQPRKTADHNRHYTRASYQEGTNYNNEHSLPFTADEIYSLIMQSFHCLAACLSFNPFVFLKTKSFFLQTSTIIPPISRLVLASLASRQHKHDFSVAFQSRIRTIKMMRICWMSRLRSSITQLRKTSRRSPDNNSPLLQTLEVAPQTSPAIPFASSPMTNTIAFRG